MIPLCRPDVSKYLLKIHVNDLLSDLRLVAIEILVNEVKYQVEDSHLDVLRLLLNLKEI